MSNDKRVWRRQQAEFWRAHHEAWKRSDLNQRLYCEAQGIPQKALKTGARFSRLSHSRQNASCFTGGTA